MQDRGVLPIMTSTAITTSLLLNTVMTDAISNEFNQSKSSTATAVMM